MKWIGQHIYDLAARFRGDVTIEGDLTVNGTYTQIDTDVTTTEQWLVTNDGTGPAAIINQKGSQDIFDVQDDGTSVFYIEDGGDIGIGTTSPSAPLHVNSITTGEVLKLESTSAPYIRFVMGGVNKGFLQFTSTHSYLSNQANGNFYFRTNNTDKMVITSAGLVGIGTSSPATKLHINDGTNVNLKIGVASGELQIKSTNDADTAYTPIIFRASEYNILNGNVGIGTSSPSVNLQVYDALSSQIKITNGLATPVDLQLFASSSSYAGIGTSTNHRLALRTNNSEKLTILGDGNVGIGTSSPSEKLDVAGNIKLNGNGNQIRDYNGNNIISNASNTLTIGSAAISTTYVRGNVGIGTSSPASLLHVAGTVQVGVDDTGHDVVFYGATSGKKLTWDESADGLYFADNTYLRLGTGGDVKMWHNGTDSYIMNQVGNLNILNSANDKDIILTSDDGSGGHTAYLTLDGSAGTVEVAKATNFANNVTIQGSGDSADGLHLKDRTFVAFSDAGSVVSRFRSSASGVFQLQDGSYNTGITLKTNAASTFTGGGITVGVDDTGYDVKFFGATSGRFILWDESDDSLKFTDNTKIKLGTGNDLEIYHDGSHSFIVDNGTGNLWIGSNGGSIYLGDEGANETFLKATDNGNVELYYDNVKKLETKSDGVDITGELQADSLDIDGNATFAGTLTVGVDNAGHDVVFYGDTSSRYLQWDQSADKLLFRDNVKGVFGNADDLQIYHNGTDSVIDNVSGGDLYISQKVADKDLIFRADDGSGGFETYFFLDGSAGGSNPRTVFPDDSRLCLGSGHDLKIFNNGSDSFVSQETAGDLYIRNIYEDKDIIFQSDDGSGGVETYFFLDGSTGRTIFPDNKELRFGTGSDLNLYHNGTSSFINNMTGDLNIRNYANDKDIIFQSDDGSGGVTAYLTLDGSTKTVDVDVPIEINDQMLLGSKQAYTLPAQGTRMRLLQIADHTLCRVYLETSENSYHQPIVLDIFYRAQHNTSKPQIVRSESYEWHLHSNDVIFTSDQAGTAGADSYIYAEKVAYSTGRPLNIRKIEVFDGTLTVLDGSTTDTNGGTDETIVSTFAEVNLGDNDYLKIGNDTDLYLSHDATNSHIANATGDLKITQNANDKDIIFNCDDGSGGTATYFYLDGSEAKTIVSQTMEFQDNVKLAIGNSEDMTIDHNATDTRFMNYTGDLRILNAADDKDITLECDDGSGGVTAYLTLDGSAGTIVASKPLQSSNVLQATPDKIGNITIQRESGSGAGNFDVNALGSYVLSKTDGGFGVGTKPSGSHNGVGFISLQTHTGNYFTQLALSTNTNDLFIRSANNASTFSSYERLVKEDDVILATDIIKVLPHHFMSNEDGGANKSAQFRDDTIIGVRTSADDAELYAFVEIPYGKTARTVTVYGNDTSLVVNVFESDINAGALTDKTPGAGCVVGTECDITDVAYSATNYLVIKVTTVSYTNDIVYGAVVTIG